MITNSVVLLLTDYLYHLSDAITSGINSTSGSDQDFLKVITKPFTNLIIQVHNLLLLLLPTSKYHTGRIIHVTYMCNMHVVYLLGVLHMEFIQMYYICRTFVIQYFTYIIQVFYMCTNTCVIKVYILSTYYMCRNA